MLEKLKKKLIYIFSDKIIINVKDEKICLNETKDGIQFIGKHIDVICNIHQYAVKGGILSLQEPASSLRLANKEESFPVKKTISSLYKFEPIPFFSIENM
jgi:hypothetical protein